MNHRVCEKEMQLKKKNDERKRMNNNKYYIQIFNIGINIVQVEREAINHKLASGYKILRLIYSSARCYISFAVSVFFSLVGISEWWATCKSCTSSSPTAWISKKHFNKQLNLRQPKTEQMIAMIRIFNLTMTIDCVNFPYDCIFFFSFLQTKFCKYSRRPLVNGHASTIFSLVARSCKKKLAFNKCECLYIHNYYNEMHIPYFV